MTSEKPALSAYLDNIRITLTRTSHPSNIGSAAHAMKIMGLHRLTIVTLNLTATPMTENPPAFDLEHPQSFKLPEESFILASGAADVLENAIIAASLDEAFADTIIACALTSRRREVTAPLQTPRELVSELLQATNRGEKMALVFGNETFGSGIEEVQACNRLMTINGNPDYFSLNLAQAVRVVCYEISSQTDSPMTHLQQEDHAATHEQIKGMVARMESVMNDIGFFDRHNGERLIRRMQSLFERANTQTEDIDILRDFPNTVSHRIHKRGWLRPSENTSSFSDGMTGIRISMNYALDALWWKLTSQPVRDLASLLTAPPLWQGGYELNARELLREHGFRYLLALDVGPAPLGEYLVQHAPFEHRLGIYAEELLAFWFANVPHTKLYAYNLLVFSDGQTLGAADFVVSFNQQLYHIELACKYYGRDQVQNLRGLNTKDTLTDKAAKLVQQSQLLYTPQGKAILAAQGLPENPLPTPIVRGIGFFPQSFHTFEPSLNPYGQRGIYIRDWKEYGFERQEARYHLLDRMTYLTPACVAETEILNATEIRRINQGLIAILELRPDGFWHEIERIMKAV